METKNANLQNNQDTIPREDIPRLTSPVSLIAMCLMIESRCLGQKDLISVSLLQAIRRDRLPILEILRNIREFAADNPRMMDEVLGIDLMASINSLEDLTDYEREHMERTGTILPGSRFIHFSLKNKTS